MEEAMSDPTKPNETKANEAALEAGTIDALRAQLKDANDKNATYERERKEASDKKLAENNEYKTLAENREKELAAERAKTKALTDGIIHNGKMNAIRQAAAKAGLRAEAMDDLDMVDFEEVQVERTDKGRLNVTGAEKAVEKLKATKPHWFAARKPNVDTSKPGVETNVSELVTEDHVIEAEDAYRKSGSDSDKKKYHDLANKYRTQPAA
jgi:hypothetical protein